MPEIKKSLFTASGQKVISFSEEVMALMDEEESRVVRSESFNTSWKEIFGETPKKTVHEYPDAAKVRKQKTVRETPVGPLSNAPKGCFQCKQMDQLFAGAPRFPRCLHCLS